MTLEVAIPDTSLEDCSSLREKTVKIGQLARGFAVFKVEKVLVYRTEQMSAKSRKDFDLLVKLLRYMDIPQYLRQRIFSHSPSLKFAGLLPPLRTRSHPLAAGVKDLSVGDIRWGIQARKGSIDLGLDRPLRFLDSVSERIPTLFRVRSVSPSPRIEVIEREDVEYYFGFEVTPIDDLIGVLRDSTNMTRISFSRMGTAFDAQREALRSTVVASSSVLAVFGGPRQGVRQLLSSRMAELKENIDFWVNTIRDQGTETVRLEEAVMTSLALLNDSMGLLYAKHGYHE